MDIGEGAAIFAERWRQSVESMRLQLEGGENVEVTISLGVAVWDSDVENSEAVVAAADAALYQAKQSGRNRVAVAGAT